MNTNRQGQITELQVLQNIIELGFDVSIPFGDKSRYDQIWDINGKLLRVQIKTARRLKNNDDGIKFNCYSVCNGKKKHYSKDDTDLIVTIWNNILYAVPVEECPSEKILRFDSKQPNQPNISWAKDYTLKEILSKI